MILDDLLGTDRVLVLDGAIGSEITRLGAPMDSPAWCGVANHSHPDVVRRVHVEYIRAGANIVTSNTFATCRHVLDGAGLGKKAATFTQRAVELAREAIDEAGVDAPVVVAGSMSNNLAWIPGKFSPDPRFKPTPEVEAANYREMAEALAEAGADLIVLEMMSDIEHASMLAEAARATGLPLWIGISSSLRPDGSVTAWDLHNEEPADRIDAEHRRAAAMPLTDVIDAMAGFEPQVMGIMHSTSTAMSPALRTLYQHWSGPVMAYPEATNLATIEPAAFAARCRDWVAGGVQIIGGCCGTTIEHIRAMVESLPDKVGPRSALA